MKVVAHYTPPDELTITVELSGTVADFKRLQRELTAAPSYSELGDYLLRTIKEITSAVSADWRFELPSEAPR